MRTHPITRVDAEKLVKAYNELSAAYELVQRLDNLQTKPSDFANLELPGYDQRTFNSTTIRAAVPEMEAKALFRAIYDARLKKAQDAVIALGGEA